MIPSLVYSNKQPCSIQTYMHCRVVTAADLWLLQSCDCCRVVTAAELWLLQGFDCCRAKCLPRPFCLSCARLWPTFTFYGVADLLSVSSFIPKISLQCTSPWNTQPWPKPSPFQKTVLLKLKQVSALKPFLGLKLFWVCVTFVKLELVAALITLYNCVKDHAGGWCTLARTLVVM